jgi:hypothetical protein
VDAARHGLLKLGPGAGVEHLAQPLRRERGDAHFLRFQRRILSGQRVDSRLLHDRDYDPYP